MFESFLGLPLHPLAVHAAVVFVPLLALAAIIGTVVPKVRPKINWASWGLGVIAPVTVFVAAEAGEALQQALIADRSPQTVLDAITGHAQYARTTFYTTIGLGVVTILRLLLVGSPKGRRLPRWGAIALTVITLVLAAVALVCVYLTGESGARMVWQGVV